MIRNFFITFLLFSITQLTQAKTLIVSDIDDTLKVAHVLDFDQAALYAFNYKIRFMGMSELLHLLVKDNSETQMVYLTRAPEWLMSRTHRKFLAYGQFPEGLYIPRSTLSSENHKLFMLRKLINEINPDKVILIGDNTEMDPQVYAQIALEYAPQGIRFYQFIRIVQNRVESIDLNSQIKFVTPIDLSLELEKYQLLSFSSVDWMMSNLAPKILAPESRYEKVFPSFINCSEFAWSWDSSLPRFEILMSVRDLIEKRCHPQL